MTQFGVLIIPVIGDAAVAALTYRDGLRHATLSFLRLYPVGYLCSIYPWGPMMTCEHILALIVWSPIVIGLVALWVRRCLRYCN